MSIQVRCLVILNPAIVCRTDTPVGLRWRINFVAMKPYSLTEMMQDDRERYGNACIIKQNLFIQAALVARQVFAWFQTVILHPLC